jgi:hypothetical protein
LGSAMSTQKAKIANKQPGRSVSPVKVAARRVMNAIEDRKWDRSFAQSHNVLEQLADEAIAEHRAGRTKPIDPDRM